MKKVILLLAVIASAFSAMAQTSMYIYSNDGSAKGYTITNIDSISFTKPPGVLINGVRWASRNVAAPGTFAANPEDAGYFYQWNNKEGWPATGAIGSIIATNGTTWNSSWTGGFTTASDADTWATDRDPSPAGYRVPTYAEIQTLLNTTYVSSKWTTQNGVSGCKFTDITSGNSIFLPASGYRLADGTLVNVGTFSEYWSSTAYDDSYAYLLDFGVNSTSWDDDRRASGLSIRPVAE
jgi:uncharacterized protein (TIGR02145 family)